MEKHPVEGLTNEALEQIRKDPRSDDLGSWRV